jgi:hypothetical protein
MIAQSLELGIATHRGHVLSPGKRLPVPSAGELSNT